MRRCDTIAHRSDSLPRNDSCLLVCSKAFVTVRGQWGRARGRRGKVGSTDQGEGVAAFGRGESQGKCGGRGGGVDENAVALGGLDRV